METIAQLINWLNSLDLTDRLLLVFLLAIIMFMFLSRR